MLSKPDIALKEATTDLIVDRLVLDMLQQFFSAGARPDLDEKISNAWLTIKGTPFFPRSVTPTYLRGFPGQGKTTSFRVAAEKVAYLIGFDFVVNPADTYIPTGNELLFVIQELSGQVSSVDFGGIPNVSEFETSEGTLQPYMTKLANKRLAALRHAGAAVLLLDDFSNASPNIQNVALSILTENRFQGLELGNTLVGATGNLGTADGTHVSATSNAIVTRVASFLVVDTIDHWISRTCLTYPDEVGDAGISGFLQRYPDLFHTPKRSRDGVPYPCPRSWSMFVPKLREIIFGYRQQCLIDPDKTPQFPFDDIEFEAAGILGLEVAHKLASYYLSQMKLSDPIALEVIRDGELSATSKEKFRKEYARGFAANSQQFAYQYMTALADYAAKAFLDCKGNEERENTLCDAFATGLYGERTDHALMSYCSNYFALRLVLLSQNDDSIGRIDEKGRPELNDKLIEQIAAAMTKQPIAREVIETSNGGRAVRVMDETFCQVVSHFSGYRE